MVLIFLWFGWKDLFTLYKLVVKINLSLTIKTDGVTSGKMDVELHEWLRAVQGWMG